MGKTKINNGSNEMKLKRLQSVGSAIDMMTGIVYPMTQPNSIYIKDIDFSAGVYVEECSDEWFEKINDKDHSIIAKYFRIEDGFEEVK